MIAVKLSRKVAAMAKQIKLRQVMEKAWSVIQERIYAKHLKMTTFWVALKFSMKHKERMRNFYFE